MQYAIVILDGASGDPVEEFDGKTSLEAAATPNLDALARSGNVGLMNNVPEGMESCSNVACFSIVGYDPARYPIGRGAIEGAALGIELEPGQVAMRLNLVNIEDDIMRGYSVDNISTEDGNALARELKEALDDDMFTLYPGTSFRQILVVNDLPALMDLDYTLPHDISDQAVAGRIVPAASASDEGQQAAISAIASYVERAHEVLANSAVNAQRIARGAMPATDVWAFWPGVKPSALESFSDVYGKSAAMCSAVDLLDGIALMTGMEIRKADGITDGPDNDFELQGKLGVSMLEDGSDVVVVHVEAPDAAGHDGRPDEKVAGIEKSDRFILGPLLDYSADHPLRIAVMPDHPTPLSTRKHSYDPVPFVAEGPGIAANGALRMTEAEAGNTSVVFDDGWRFLSEVLFSEEG